MKLTDTEAYIMMEFSRAVNHLRGLPLTNEIKLAVGTIARPYFDRLVAKGNTTVASARLLQDTYSLETV